MALPGRLPWAWLFGLVVTAALVSVATSAAAATEYGFHELSGPDDIVVIDAAAPLFVCVAGPPDAEVLVLRSGPADAPVAHTYLVSGGTPTCATIAANAGLRSHTDGVVARVLVLTAEPVVPSTPGVLRLDDAGDGLLVSGLTSRGSIGVLMESSDARVTVVDADGFQEVASFSGRGEHRVGPSQLDGPAYVVVEEVAAGAVVLVAWEDAGWYPRAPSIAHLVTVVVAAALVIVPTGRDAYPLRARARPSPAT